MRSSSLLAVAWFLFLVTVSSAREPILMQLKNEAMRLEVRDGRLFVARGGGRAVSVSDGLENVTNFAVAEWMNGAGLALVIEVEGFDNSRTYWWMTIWVRDAKAWPVINDPGDLGFGMRGKGRILENVEALSILSLSGPGDRVLVDLCDPRKIPDTERKLAFFFHNDCAISTKLNTGKSLRHYLTPTAVSEITKESKHHIWQAEQSPDSSRKSSPSVQ